jgi:hypothetical protein
MKRYFASLTCVFYLRHSSNWNPHRLHSEPFPPKEKHNVGLLRFDDDHDHICYRFAQVRIFGGKSNVFKSLQTCLQICLFLDVYKHCWVNPICAILLYILASVVCSLIPSAFSSPIKHFSELHVSCCPISFYLKIFVLINAINY